MLANNYFHTFLPSTVCGGGDRSAAVGHTAEVRPFVNFI